MRDKVATLALGLSAEDKTYQPAPANCYAFSVNRDNCHSVKCESEKREG